jgi:hypothetical protein
MENEKSRDLLTESRLNAGLGNTFNGESNENKFDRYDSE